MWTNGRQRGISGDLSSGIVATFAPEWVAYFVAESWRPLQRNIHESDEK